MTRVQENEARDTLGPGGRGRLDHDAAPGVPHEDRTLDVEHVEQTLQEVRERPHRVPLAGQLRRGAVAGGVERDRPDVVSLGEHRGDLVHHLPRRRRAERVPEDQRPPIRRAPLPDRHRGPSDVDRSHAATLAAGTLGSARFGTHRMWSTA